MSADLDIDPGDLARVLLANACEECSLDGSIYCRILYGDAVHRLLWRLKIISG